HSLFPLLRQIREEHRNRKSAHPKGPLAIIQLRARFQRRLTLPGPFHTRTASAKQQKYRPQLFACLGTLANGEEWPGAIAVASLEPLSPRKGAGSQKTVAALWIVPVSIGRGRAALAL